MIQIAWSITAFDTLENLPPKTAFEIVGYTDRLMSFPELGIPLQHPYSRFGNCRLLILRRRYRLVYLFDERQNEVRILMLQQCRQQLPTMSELHRTIKETDE
jgi:hypothetical protein